MGWHSFIHIKKIATIMALITKLTTKIKTFLSTKEFQKA
jgi:hypothetical protein